MLIIYTIVMRLARMSNTDLLAFIRRVISMMTANVNYPTPTNPTLLQMTTIADDFEDAIEAWGDVHNRGSHLDKMQVDAMRILVEQALRGAATYCENTTPNQPLSFASAGFDSTRTPSPIDVLNPVRNVRQVVTIGFYNSVKLRWQRPIDVPKGIVKGYLVYRGITDVLGDAIMVGTVTKTTFTDSGLTNPYYYYWIIPFAAIGQGGVCDAYMASVALRPV